MSNPGRRRLALRTLTAVFGVGLLIYLVRRVGSDNLLANVKALGWGLALIIAFGRGFVPRESLGLADDSHRLERQDFPSTHAPLLRCRRGFSEFFLSSIRHPERAN